MIHHAVIVAGPNGAGKSTFARQLIALSKRNYEFLNADDIARDLPSELTSGAQGRRAGELLLQRIAAAVATRNDFMLETTLSGRTYLNHIRHWRAAGYRSTLHFLRLASVEDSISRVKRRIAAGGHGIPEADLIRRFPRSLQNFQTIYRPIVDEWRLYDSFEGSFLLVGEGRNS